MKKANGTAQARNLSAANRNGGSSASPALMTTKLVPQTATIRNASATWSGRRGLFKPSSLRGHRRRHRAALAGRPLVHEPLQREGGEPDEDERAPGDVVVPEPIEDDAAH